MDIKDRIKEFRRVPASQLVPNPKNWRTHPKAQRDALRGVLSEIGIADAALARELPDGRLMLIDGHLRQEELIGNDLPVLVLDVTEEEADKLLLTIDPLAAMAEADTAQLDALLRSVQSADSSVVNLLEGLAEQNGLLQGEQETELKQLDTRPQPKLTWVLLAIPTVRFGEIADAVERLAKVPGIVLETTSNDG